MSMTLIAGGSVNLPSSARPMGPQNQFPQSANFFGADGWFSVPRNELFNNIPGWPVTKSSSGALMATDPYGRKFSLKTNQALELVFQTMLPVW